MKPVFVRRKNKHIRKATKIITIAGLFFKKACTLNQLMHIAFLLKKKCSGTATGAVCLCQSVVGGQQIVAHSFS
jgi:hypothetical protein